MSTRQLFTWLNIFQLCKRSITSNKLNLEVAFNRDTSFACCGKKGFLIFDGKHVGQYRRQVFYCLKAHVLQAKHWYCIPRCILWVSSEFWFPMTTNKENTWVYISNIKQQLHFEIYAVFTNKIQCLVFGYVSWSCARLPKCFIQAIYFRCSLLVFKIIDLLATDKSRYFAQPRPIIKSDFL